MHQLVTEWYGSGVYPTGGALDVMSQAAGLGHTNPYAGTLMLPRSFKMPTDSPALLMVSEKDASKLIKRTLEKALDLEKGIPDFITAAYQVVNFVSSQRLTPQKLRLHGKSKLTFKLDFPNAQGLDRSFVVTLFRKGKDMGYDLKLTPIGVTPANAPTVFFKKSYSDVR